MRGPSRISRAYRSGTTGPDALDPDPSYNGYLLNVFAGFDGRGLLASSSSSSAGSR
ncbi:MAG: hypothetical protein ACLT98_00545 [Eggerthellaceae bacterium]